MRPAMGPLLYAAAVGCFTQFHLDGYGSVDAMHLCVTGYNEVIVLGRLVRHEMIAALMILTGLSQEDVTKMVDGAPHDGGLLSLAMPTNQQVEACRKQGYTVSRLILSPGQMISLPKLCAHCFRKMSFDELPETDCFHDIRKDFVDKNDLVPGAEEMNISCLLYTSPSPRD